MTDFKKKLLQISVNEELQLFKEHNYIYFVNEKKHTIGRICDFRGNEFKVETLQAFNRNLFFHLDFRRVDDNYFDDCEELSNQELAEITFDDYAIAYHRVQVWGLHGNSCFKNS